MRCVIELQYAFIIQTSLIFLWYTKTTSGIVPADMKMDDDHFETFDSSADLTEEDCSGKKVFLHS